MALNKLLFPLFFAFTLLIAVMLNYQSFNYFFFQDDWFVLNSVRSLDFWQLGSLLVPRTDIIYYRPFGMQGFFYFAYNLFGLSSFFFHLLSFAFHVINVYLLFKVGEKLLNNRIASLCVMFFYATAAFHFMTFGWLVLTWNTIANTFIFLSIIFYVKSSPKIYYKLGSFFTFIIALLSSEFALIVPIILFFVQIGFFSSFKSRNSGLAKIYWKNIGVAIKKLLLFFLVVPVYLFFRLVLFPLPAQGSYSPALQIGILKDIFWYFAWFINVPELLKFHFNFTSLKISADMMQAVGGYLPAVLFLFLSQLVFLAMLAIKALSGKTVLVGILSLFLFLVSLGPVIFLPDHSYAYYLTLPSLFLLFFIGHLIKQSIGSGPFWRAIVGLFIVNWLALTSLSFVVNRKSHWIVMEQALSRKITSASLKMWATLEDGDVLAVYPGSKQVSQSLMDQEAFKTIYGKKVRTSYLQSSKPGTIDGKLLMWNK